ncbi:MAG: MFS transporter [Hyphomicrobiales bacterium]|nr:MAG: MFS transporter [Hyphomicrobiales bacterium]
MISDALATALAKRNIHYGWVVAGTTFLVMLSTAGAMGAGGVLIGPLTAEFGWTTAQISTALAVRFILFGLIAPFAAAFMNYFGVRKVVTAALLLIGSGVLASLFMRELWQLLALWGVVIGIGTGMTALVLGATIATRWFEKRRGLVVGLMTASNATGQLIFLPLLAMFSESIGWRAALIFVTIMLVVGLVLALLFMRDRPADVGLAPYGGTAIVPAPAQSKRLSDLITSPLLVLREASRTAVFWVLFATFFVCGLSTGGLIQTHWISICSDAGIAALAAAGMLALIGAFDFVGTIVSGWLSDRYDNRYLLLAYYGLRGVSLLFLPYSGYSITMLTIFAVFYGLDWVATVPPTVKLTAQHFGAEKASLVFGWVFAGHQIGSATAALLGGISRTALDTYTPALLFAGVFCIFAALLVLTIGKKPAPQLRPATA